MTLSTAYIIASCVASAWFSYEIYAMLRQSKRHIDSLREENEKLKELVELASDKKNGRRSFNEEW